MRIYVFWCKIRNRFKKQDGMKRINLKALLGISGLALLTVGVAVDSDIFNFSGLALRLSHATPAPGTITLNQDNAPTLSGGAGSIIDEKGVKWEYDSCSSYANGHVTLNADSYFGVASDTQYGITAITGIRVNFTGTEFWLLTSVDGTNWNEEEKITTEKIGETITSANDWRFVRFYNYSSTINIISVAIDYNCNGTSAQEDMDGAKDTNVVSTSSNLTHAPEYNELSPNSDGGEAVSCL